MSAPAKSAAPSGFRAPPKWVVFLFLALGITVVAAAFFIPLPNRQPAVSGDAPPAPLFVLTERSGKEISNEDLDGKVWVASFVFTRCKMGCPAVTGTMRKLQTELKLADRDDLRLITFTVDPERDNLTDLKEYADKYQAHETKWLFLTGPERFVRLMLNKGFRITAMKRADPKPGDEFDHSTKLLVVDKRGKVRGYFDGMPGEHDEGGKNYEEGQKALRKLVDELARE
jgi:cytochrome oxidase Cu insertion factor (SCO1/SenC/PrrC family)